jgi:hypothetical protein
VPGLRLYCVLRVLHKSPLAAICLRLLQVPCMLREAQGTSARPPNLQRAALARCGEPLGGPQGKVCFLPWPASQNRAIPIHLLIFKVFIRHGSIDDVRCLAILPGCEAGESGSFVLKHISSHKGRRARLSGLREAYFGTLLQQLNQTVSGAQAGASEDGVDRLVRFVESFQVGCTI